MIISSSFCYLFFRWRCFNVSLFRQCSIIVLCCSTMFQLFRRCSVVLVVFRCSGIVPSFSGCSMFRCSSSVPLLRRCSVILQVFRVPLFWCYWFYSMPFFMQKPQCSMCWLLDYFSRFAKNFLCYFFQKQASKDHLTQGNILKAMWLNEKQSNLEKKMYIWNYLFILPIFFTWGRK